MAGTCGEMKPERGPESTIVAGGWYQEWKTKELKERKDKESPAYMWT